MSIKILINLHNSPFTVSVNKYEGTCNTIYDPYTQIYVPNEIKNMNVKVFNLM